MSTRRNGKPKSFGERFHDWRIDFNVTLEEAGELLGVWASTIMRWEKRRVEPNERIQRKAERLIEKGAPPVAAGARR